ncbi:MAG: flavin reductase family protein [Desulfobacterales bacterium]|nr:flavin reductase family protein [Desulfobacterales bacterium]MBF0396487.1 flavin reductase family protein [Desulfobacterales bacterium]
MKKSLGAKTILYPTPVLIVGTYDKEGKPNVMTAAWGGICCSEPPCVTISLRKATYSYSNIQEQKAYTINIPSENYVKESDYFGMVSGKTNDKFKASGLNAVKSSLVNAPYIKEFPMILECKLLHSFEIGLHTQFIGEIIDVKVNEELIDENGHADIEKIKPIIFSPGIRKYYGLGGFLGNAFSIGKIFCN